MKLILLIIGLMLLIGTASATAYYDQGTNTIEINDTNAPNTLSSMCSDLNNVSLLSYNGATNTYTLHLTIQGSNISLEDTTLIINSTSGNTVKIGDLYNDFVINNMTINPMDYSYPYSLEPYGSVYTGYSIFINSSDISGGRISCSPLGYNNYPTKPTEITNNIFHNYTTTANGMLSLSHGSSVDSTIRNNTFENVHITDGGYNGIVRFQGFNGVDIEKLYINNCSVSSYGMTYFYGVVDTATLTDIEITDCIGNGISGKEYGNLNISGLSVTNLSGYGLHLYYSSSSGKTFYIENSTMNDVGDGISRNGYFDYVDLYVYNVTINDTGYGLRFDSKINSSVTNSLITNYSTMYVSSETLRWYELTDILVEDSSGNPIEGATVTLTCNNTDIEKTVVNRNLQTLAQTTTLANGHTPLPNQSTSNTVSILRFLTNSSYYSNYQYTISVDAVGYDTNNSVTILPLDSWYRSNVDSYQNTTTVILGGWSHDSNSTYDGQICTYYTDGSRLCTTPVESDAVIFTNNIHPVVT